jgi:hypothetical protein
MLNDLLTRWPKCCFKDPGITTVRPWINAVLFGSQSLAKLAELLQSE